MPLLSQRAIMGYPDATVELYADFDADTHSVIVHDGSGSTVLCSEVNRARARDCYFHPFAFGYVKVENA
jgi:hypothetical protein